MTVLLILLLVIGAVTLGPLIFIWALNTLFGLGISYTLLNWFAAFCLWFLVNGGSGKTSK